MTTDPEVAALVQYRTDRRWSAVSWSVVLVVVATLAGAWVAATAVRPRSFASAPSINPVTRDVVRRSVARVIDARLDPARLRLLLGVEPAPAAGSDAAKLSAAAQAAGVMGLKAGAADYLTTSVPARGGELSATLADLMPREPLNTIQLAAGASLKDRQSAIARLAIIESTALSEAVTAWTTSVGSDRAIDMAWSRLSDRTDTLAAFLTNSALDFKTLPAAIASQIAADVSLASLPVGEADLAAKDLTARLAWATTVVLFFGLWVAAVAVCFWQMWTLLPSGGWVALLSIVMAFGVGAMVNGFTPLGPAHLELLGPLLVGYEADLGTHIIGVSRALNSLIAGAIVLMLVASVAVTWREAGEMLAAQTEGLRTILNAGAALLIAAALEIAALYGWVASAYDAASGGSKTLADAALIAAGFSGTLFSVILMVIYVPTAALLRRRAIDGKVEALLTKEGLDDTAGQRLMRVLQALSPFLAAVPLSGLLAMLGS